MVFVTGWNEWVAQRFTVAKGQRIDLAGRPLAEGDTFFVDLYSPEFSRDIDPMRGGYTDDYYYRLVANVRRFKGARPLPKPSVPLGFDPKRDPSGWRKVLPEYRDAVGDTLHRDFDGWGDLHYRNATGRNDIVAAKVARTGGQVSFYARAAAPLTPATDPDWMILRIDTDGDSATGRFGDDLRVAKGRLQRWAKGWRDVCAAPTRVVGNAVEITLPGRFLPAKFDFKWADACGDDDPMFLDGDAAPPRRFRYHYGG